MSIPKEPRQLMVNLMYLFLTVMLALNVSAEILNAFLVMDEGITESSNIVGNSNAQILAAIDQQADAYRQFEPLREKAQSVKALTEAFSNFIQQHKLELVEASGGYDEKGKLVGIKNKDITTRMYVIEGKGDTIAMKIKQLRKDLLGLVEDNEVQATLEKQMPLQVKPLPADTKADSWAAFTFEQMPVAAVLPLLSKFENDAKIAETALLNYFLSQTDMVTMKPDAFEAVVAADKSYVIRGEDLQAEIFLGAYSSTADNISVQVNGRRIPVRNGKAVFNTRPEGLGEKDLDVLINVTNPISGEVKSYRKKFNYEVGERSVAVSADKMNVLYIGVENPLTISAAGIPSTEMNVSASNVQLRKVNNSQFIAIPDQPGDAKITVSGGGLDATTFNYRVKRIPTPVPMIGRYKSSARISPNEFKAYEELKAIHEHFDFDARCKVTGFEVTRVPKKADVLDNLNQGGRYDARTQRIIQQATFGDIYYFEKIKARCPGDKASRTLNSMVFRIR